MGKRYDAEEVASFIYALDRGVSNCNTHALGLQTNYKAYIDNNEYRGVLAEETKKYISTKHMQIHNGSVWIQQKLLNVYDYIETYFKETVDRSDKARIDTDVLITTKKDFCTYRNVVDVHGGAIEGKAKWLQGKFSEFHSFTQPNYNRVREEYDEFCGSGKFLDQCLKKFRDFDSETCDYVDRTGLEDIVDEHRVDMSRAADGLNTIKIFNPKLEMTDLSLITGYGAKAVVSRAQYLSSMTQEEKVDMWLLPDYKLSDEEIKEAREIASGELSKVEYIKGTHKPILNTEEEKENYARYVSLMNKCSKFSSFCTTMTKPLIGLMQGAANIVEDVLGTAAEMGADACDTTFGTNATVYVLNMREMYNKKSEEVDALYNTMSANATTQNPGAAAVGHATGMAIAYYITKPIFNGIVSKIGVKSKFAQFLANQFGQNLQDIVVDTMPLYKQLAADGLITDEEWGLLGENVTINVVMNLFQAEVDEAIDIAKQKNATKSLAELSNLGSVAEKNSVKHAVGSAGQAQSVLDGIDPKYFNKNSRFGGGFYVGADGDTIVAELAEHGNTAKYAIGYDMDLTGQKVLDLTDSSIASEWGYVQGYTSTEACQQIGELARKQGYNVIEFQSYRGEGINYVIYNNFDEILSPTSVTPIP